MDRRHSKGAEAEAAACDHLQQQGLTLIERNYRCRQGEIDLIMRAAKCLVFVEVRYRASSRFGSSAESVDWRKQGKLINAANHYLQRHSHHGPSRFDVVAVTSHQEQLRLEWIRDAFQA